MVELMWQDKHFKVGIFYIIPVNGVLIKSYLYFLPSPFHISVPKLFHAQLN